jgi:hypothetical protein
MGTGRKTGTETVAIRRAKTATIFDTRIAIQVELLTDIAVIDITAFDWVGYDVIETFSILKDFIDTEVSTLLEWFLIRFSRSISGWK